MKTLKNKLKQIGTKINDIWVKYIIGFKTKRTLDKLKKKAEQDKIDELNKLKFGFEKQFNVSVDDIKRVINSDKTSPRDKEYLDAELVKGRKYIIENKTMGTSAPLFYEPAICDMHNENPDRSSYPTTSEIHAKDMKMVQEMLEQQGDFKRKLAKLKAITLWRTRN